MNIWNHLTICKQMIQLEIELFVFDGNTWKHLTSVQTNEL